MAELGLHLPADGSAVQNCGPMKSCAGPGNLINSQSRGRKILSVLQGQRPAPHQGQPLASFDGFFLLSQAMAAGAQHVGAGAQGDLGG